MAKSPYKKKISPMYRINVQISPYMEEILS